MKKLIIILLFTFTQTPFAQWTNGQDATFVVGQTDLNSETGNIFSGPQKVAIDYTHGKLYVADPGSNVVLRFAYPVTANDPAVEETFGTGTAGTAQNQFDGPYGVAVYNGTLWVSDIYNNRILKFNNAYSVSTNAPNADGVLGQTNYTGYSSGTSQSTLWYPGGIYIDASGNLWAADEANSRILEFKNVNSKSNGANADLVLGQSDFTTGTSGVSNTQMDYPWSVAVLGTTVWVADYNNNRVLRFDNPTSNGAAANGVLGQTDFNSNTLSTTNITNNTFDHPCDLDVDPSGRLYVSDEENARIMIFNNAASKVNGGPADNVLGQSGFSSLSTSGGGPNLFYDTSTDHNVEGVTVDAGNNELLVVDQMNARVMVFASNSVLPVEITTFSALVKGTTVKLSWQTATEVNNLGYDIERSRETETDSQNPRWEKIGFIQGRGNSDLPENYTFVDDNPLNGKVEYRLKQIDNDGSFKYSSIVTVNLLPNKFVLYQNYPNPFNPTTTIQYAIPKEEHVTVKVYNELGKEVRIMVNENESAGQYRVIFNGANLASGIYYYKITAGNLSRTRKLLLLK